MVFSDLPARHRADDSKWLFPVYDTFRQANVQRLQRPILPIGEEADEGAPLFRDVVTDRPLQHRVLMFKRIQDRLDRNGRFNSKLNLPRHSGQILQVIRQLDANHFRVWTSTDRTAGRLLAMGIQLSPESAEA